MHPIPLPQWACCSDCKMQACLLHPNYFQWRQSFTCTESFPCFWWRTLSLWFAGSTLWQRTALSIPRTPLPLYIHVPESWWEPLRSKFGRLSDTYSQTMSSHLSSIVAHFNHSTPKQSRQLLRCWSPTEFMVCFPFHSEAETFLTRPAHVALSQLRSGLYSLLIDYWAIIGAADSSLCPDWAIQDKTVGNSFSYPTNPTNLAPLDLWDLPVEVARYLFSANFSLSPLSRSPPKLQPSLI